MLWSKYKWFFPNSEYFTFSYESGYKKDNEDKIIINIDWTDIIESSVFDDGIFMLINKKIYKHKIEDNDKKIFNFQDSSNSISFNWYEVNNDSIKLSNNWDIWFLLWKIGKWFQKEYVFINWKVIETGYIFSDFNRNSFKMALSWNNYIIRQFKEWKWDYFITKNKIFWPFIYDELNRLSISDDWNLIISNYKKDDKYYYQLIWKKNNNLEMLNIYWPYDDWYEPIFSQKWWNYVLYYEKIWEAWDKKYAIINWNEVWNVNDVQLSNMKNSYIYRKDENFYINIHWKEYIFDRWIYGWRVSYNWKFYIHRDGNGFTYKYHNRLWWKIMLRNFRVKDNWK